MPTTRTIKGYGPVAFPDEMNEAQIDAKVRDLERRYAEPEQQISNPPSLVDWGRYYAREGIKQGMELTGLLGGAAVGTAAMAVSPLGPAAPLLGAGLGYAGARQAIGLLEQTGLMAKSRQPPTSGDIPLDVLTGGALQAGGPLVSLGARAMVRPMKQILGIGAASELDLAVRDAAERQGIPLTASSASGSSSVALIESFPSKFPLGRQTAEPTIEAQRAGMQGAVERLAATAGPTKTLEEAGLTIKREVGMLARQKAEAATTLIDDFAEGLGTPVAGKMALGRSLQAAGRVVQQGRRADATARYVDAINGRGAEDVALGTLLKRSQEIAAFERRVHGVDKPRILLTAKGLAKTATAPPIRPKDLSDEAVSQLIREKRDITRAIPLSSLTETFIEEYGLQRFGTRTLEETLAIQQRLNGAVATAPDDVTRRNLRELLEAVTTDIEAHVGPGPLADAAAFYRDEVGQFFGRKAGMRKALDKAASRLANTLLGGKDLELIRDTMTVMPETQKKEVQRAFFDTLIARRGVRGSAGQIDPVALEKEFQRVGDEALTLVYGSRMPALRALRSGLARQFGPETSDQALVGILEASPISIVDMMARGKIKSTQDFDAVWRVLSPQARDEARSALFQQIISNSVDLTTGLFSTRRFLTQKGLVPEDIWTRMLERNPAAALRDVVLVGQRLERYNQIAANPSQTGQALWAAAQIGAAAGLAGSTIFGREDPVSFGQKLLALLAPTLIGKAVFSRAGQALLTSQPSRLVDPQGMSGRIGTTGAALGLRHWRE